MPPLPTIACKDCGHVNEGQRVYCHNCGTKLDRSAVILQQQKEEQSPEQVRRRVKKMMSPEAAIGKKWWRTGVRTIFLAALVAALIDMVRPPEAVPPMPDSSAETPDLAAALDAMAAAPAGKRVALTESDINGFMKSTLRPKKQEGWLASVHSFQRAFVNVDPGAIRITAQNSIYDFPLYAGISYQLKIENNALVATPLGGNVGRLQIPVKLISYAGALFNPLWDAFKQEAKQLNQMGTLEMEKGQLILTSRGPTPGASAPAVRR